MSKRPGHINQLNSIVELGRDQSVYMCLGLTTRFFLYHSSFFAECLVVLNPTYDPTQLLSRVMSPGLNGLLMLFSIQCRHEANSKSLNVLTGGTYVVVK